MSELSANEVSMGRFWAINGVVVLGGIFLILCFALLPGGVMSFWDVASYQVVFGTVFVVSTVFYLKKSLAVFEIWLALGIPVGLLGGNLGLTGMVLKMSDPYAIGPASSVGLLTALYGAFITAAGYFAVGKSKKPVGETITGGQLTLILIGCGVLWLLPMLGGVGVSPFLSFPAILLYSGSILMAILMNTDKSKSLVHCVSDGALAGILVSLVAALVVWFRSSPEVDVTAVGFGNLGVMYGTMIYIVCYIVSLKTGDTASIDFRTKNWHLVEANTFYIFLVFAPVNLGESMFNELDEIERIKMVEQQDSMRSEISVLTERLAKLEGG